MCVCADPGSKVASPCEAGPLTDTSLKLQVQAGWFILVFNWFKGSGSSLHRPG